MCAIVLVLCGRMVCSSKQPSYFCFRSEQEESEQILYSKMNGERGMGRGRFNAMPQIQKNCETSMIETGTGEIVDRRDRTK